MVLLMVPRRHDVGRSAVLLLVLVVSRHLESKGVESRALINNLTWVDTHCACAFDCRCHNHSYILNAHVRPVAPVEDSVPKCKNKTRLSQSWSWSCANTPGLGLGLGLALPVLISKEAAGACIITMYFRKAANFFENITNQALLQLNVFASCVSVTDSIVIFIKLGDTSRHFLRHRKQGLIGRFLTEAGRVVQAKLDVDKYAVKDAAVLAQQAADGKDPAHYFIVKSSISQRIQKVDINRTQSAGSAVKLGVPQGSILGPFLFLMTSLIFKVNRQHKNHNITTRQEDPTHINETLAEALNWFTANNLLLNAAKTKSIKFSLPNGVRCTRAQRCGAPAAALCAYSILTARFLDGAKVIIAHGRYMA
ncbi:hypothetical protein MSG28_004431 [Choristoneura fumiferana]|uniref:Uncharacterized protein n=1 Tax=Choristoneura fumiferana TaxID=7141 RepID=A0ACC0K5X5_CHOFU|nr:hypothetical protein MSG28_004431 [Choristoneura fumiferana]